MTVTDTDIRARATELLRLNANGELSRRARQEGITLSALLEREDPSDPQERRDGLDAFGRLVRAAGIVTTSDPYGGWYADPLEAFASNEERRALFGEWVDRQWRQAQGLYPNNRAQTQYLSTDYLAGSVTRPYEDDARLRQQQVEPAIPLSEVVAITTQIDGEDYRALRLTEPAADAVRLIRTAEAAELPRVRIASAAVAIRLHKFGRAIEASYEVLRRQRIDLIAVHIRRIAIQSQVDQVAAALDVAVNGDGNSGTAATNHNLTALDPAAVAGTLTLKGWMAFRGKFTNPYAMTVAFAREDMALQVELLSVGTANVLLASAGAALGVGRTSRINQSLSDGVRMGITTDAPANKIVGMDSRFGIERVVENGSVINESERWILRQVETLTMSLNEGYATFDPQATRVLTVNA